MIVAIARTRLRCSAMAAAALLAGPALAASPDDARFPAPRGAQRLVFQDAQDAQPGQTLLPPLDVSGVPQAPPADPAPIPAPQPAPPSPAPPAPASPFTTMDFGSGLRGSVLSNFENPRAIETVTSQELLERAPLDMGQALEQTVGVMIQRTGRGQSSPFVRGLTGQQVLILVDGVRMTNATFRAGPNQYFNLIDPNMVDHVEVIRGPGSVLYGSDAIGGVINVVTKQASRVGSPFFTGGTVQRFSSADLGYTGRLSMEGSVGSAGIFAGGGYGNYNDLDIGGTPDAPAGFDPGRQPATSWRYNSADLKLNYALTPWSELVFAVQHYVAEDVFRSDRFPANRQSIFDPQQRDLFYIRLNGIDPCSCGWFDAYQITASLHRFDEVRADRDFRAGRNPLLTSFRGFVDEQTGLSGSFVKDYGVVGALTTGWDWYHDDIDSSRVDVDRSVNPPDVQSRAGEVPDDAYYSRYGVFANWDVWLTDRLLATSGVRYQHITAGATVTANNVTGKIDPEFDGFIGNVGLTYAVAPHLNLVGSISEGFRAPNIDDLATVNDNVFVGTQLPNPDLRPENSLTYEIGAKLDTPRLDSQVFVWWNDLNDFIERGAPNNQLLLERTNREAYLNGVELTGDYRLPDNWSLYGNYWYTYGKNVETGEPLSRIPPMQGILGLRRRWGGGSNWFDCYAWLVDEQDRLSPRDRSDVNRIPAGGTPGYATLNLRYGRMIDRRQRLSLNLENIFDEQYRVHGSGSDAPGINAIVTYELLH